jgi:hypothetical protein
METEPITAALINDILSYATQPIKSNIEANKKPAQNMLLLKHFLIITDLLVSIYDSRRSLFKINIFCFSYP